MRLSLAAALVMMAAPAAAACDLDALRTYPISDVLGSASTPIAWADTSFADPGHPYDPDDVENWGGPDQVDHDRAALARGLAGHKPALRSLLTLSATAEWTQGPYGIRTFFVFTSGAYLEEVLAALDAHGLAEHADIFRRGAALFGPAYGTPRERHDRWGDHRGTIHDRELDAALLALSAEYAALPSPHDVAVDLIARSETLGAAFESLERTVDDDRRLDHLGAGLRRCVDDDAPDRVAAQLATLPPPYRLIGVSYLFEAEMLNGTVHQFFYNAPGFLAPEVAAALRDMGLADHADAMQAGVDLFPTPYPRDREARRDFMLAQDDAFDNALLGLADTIDTTTIRDAMIRTAAEADILPR